MLVWEKLKMHGFFFSLWLIKRNGVLDKFAEYDVFTWDILKIGIQFRNLGIT